MDESIKINAINVIIIFLQSHFNVINILDPKEFENIPIEIFNMLRVEMMTLQTREELLDYFGVIEEKIEAMVEKYMELQYKNCTCQRNVTASNSRSA